MIGFEDFFIRIVLGEIGVHPDSNDPVLINAYMVILHFEITNILIELGKANQSTLEDVDILGEGDVSDVAESNRDMLNVDFPQVVS